MRLKEKGGLKRLHRYPQPIDTTNESARLKFSEATPRTCAWNARANPSRRTIDWRFTTADAAVSSVTNKALEQVLPVEVLKALENFNKALRREDGVFRQLRKADLAAAAARRKFE